MIIYGSINREDVRKAVREHRKYGSVCETCVVAQMVKRMFGGYVFVGTSTFEAKDIKGRVHPTEGRELIRSYDKACDRGITNIDKLYKELKGKFPGKIALATV